MNWRKTVKKKSQASKAEVLKVANQGDALRGYDRPRRKWSESRGTSSN